MDDPAEILIRLLVNEPKFGVYVSLNILNLLQPMLLIWRGDLENVNL